MFFGSISSPYIINDEFKDLLIIAESTPGPIAVNSSTYIGYKLAGVLGAFFSTLAICLPSFIIILLIASLLTDFLNYKGVKVAFLGIKPVISGLIIATGLTMFLSTLFSIL